MASLRKNVASQVIFFQLTNVTTGAAVTAGGTGNVTIDAGAQAACTGTFTHLGTGQWKYAPTQAETNGTAIGFQFTGTAAIIINIHFFTDNFDTTAANLPANVTQILGTAVSTPATAGILDVNVKNINNVAAATPGAAGGLFIAGTNAATTITTSLTTTFTGNLTGSVASVTGAVGSISDITFPTNFGATLITAAGNVGIDWGQIANKTTANALTNTTISTSQTITSVSGSVASVTGSVGSVTGAVGSVTGAVGSVTGNVGGNVVGTVASVVGNVGGNVIGSVGSVTAVSAGAITTASFGAGSLVTSVFGANFLTSALIDSTATNALADGFNTRAMVESYSVKASTTITQAQALYEINQRLQEMKIVGTTMTVNKRDQVTAAETLTLDSATTPTLISRAT